VAESRLELHHTGPVVSGPGRGVVLEGIREGVQENEARFFLEKALADTKTRPRLGEALAARCQDLLDERTRACMRKPYTRWLMGEKTRLDSGVQSRSERIFRLAAEVAGKLK